MKTIGAFQFPTAERDAWQPSIRYVALHQFVLVVARTRIEGAWKAYCGPTLGISHEREARNEESGPLANGDPLSEAHARFLFPEFEGVPYAT